MGTLVFQATLGGAVNIIGPNIANTINFTLPSADGTSGQTWTTNGSGVLAFGTLGIAGGGTGQITATAAFNALAPSQSGQSGKYLTTDGTNTSWGTNPLGTVTSVAVSGGTTGLTTSGGPITTSGTITFAGTLATANGGTNLTSFTSGGVVYASSTSALATGSTLVFDGATTRLMVNASTNGGIGSFYVGNPSASSEYMNIVTSTSGTGALLFGNTTAATAGRYAGAITYSHTANTLTFDTASTNRMVIDGSGNLGLGVTPSAWSLLKALQIENASFAGLSNTTYVGSNVYYDGANFKYISTGSATLYTLSNSAGQHQWSTAASGTAGNTISFTQTMTLDASGNLGIGTSSPSAKLHVSDGTVFASGANRGMRFGESNCSILGDSATASAANLVFYTGNAERMRIPAAGGIQSVTTISVGNATPSSSGAGITFPATQSASSDANTLDDYEEGTFTPAFDFATSNTGVTYSSQVGSYVKVGRLVTCWFDVTLSAIGSASGTANLSNLPFTVTNNANARGAASISFLGDMNSVNGLTIRADANTTKGTMSSNPANGTSSTDLTNTNFGNSSRINGTFMFYTT